MNTPIHGLHLVVIRCFNQKRTSMQELMKVIRRYKQLPNTRVMLLTKPGDYEVPHKDEIMGWGWNGNRIEVNTGDRPFWSIPLNRAVESVRRELERKRRFGSAKRKIHSVMIVSMEVDITDEQVLAMREKLFEDPSNGVVGTTFNAIKKGTEESVETGWTYNYFPRNTCAIYRSDVFEWEGGKFDLFCDGFFEGADCEKFIPMGMEDFDFCLRMATLTDYNFSVLSLGVKLTVGVNWDQVGKEKRETKAMDRIFTHLMTQFERQADHEKALTLCKAVKQGEFLSVNC